MVAFIFVFSGAAYAAPGNLNISNVLTATYENQTFNNVWINNSWDVTFKNCTLNKVTVGGKLSGGIYLQDCTVNKSINLKNTIDSSFNFVSVNGINVGAGCHNLSFYALTTTRPINLKATRNKPSDVILFQYVDLTARTGVTIGANVRAVEFRDSNFRVSNRYLPVFQAKGGKQVTVTTFMTWGGNALVGATRYTTDWLFTGGGTHGPVFVKNPWMFNPYPMGEGNILYQMWN